MDKYKILKAIGSGAFASVNKAVVKKTGEIVAIKKMNRKFSSWEECIKLREIKSLRQLDHENIIKLKEAIRVNDELNLVFEFADKTLYQYYQSYKQKGVPIPEDEIRKIMFQITSGLAYMHKYGFFHRDLKPENILLQESSDQLKICDFGLAREIRSRPPFTDYVATRWYRAPELIFKSKTYNSPVDIFALGCIFAELYLLSPLFSGNSSLDQLNKICSIMGTPTKKSWPEGYKLASEIGFSFTQYNPIPLTEAIPTMSYTAALLLAEMLQFDPQKRPSASQILDHQYFQGFVPKHIPQLTFAQQYPERANQSNQQLLRRKSQRLNSYEGGGGVNGATATVNTLNSISVLPHSYNVNTTGLNQNTQKQLSHSHSHEESEDSLSLNVNDKNEKCDKIDKQKKDFMLTSDMQRILDPLNQSNFSFHSTFSKDLHTILQEKQHEVTKTHDGGGGVSLAENKHKLQSIFNGIDNFENFDSSIEFSHRDVSQPPSNQMQMQVQTLQTNSAQSQLQLQQDSANNMLENMNMKLTGEDHQNLNLNQYQQHENSDRDFDDIFANTSKQKQQGMISSANNEQQQQQQQGIIQNQNSNQIQFNYINQKIPSLVSGQNQNQNQPQLQQRSVSPFTQATTGPGSIQPLTTNQQYNYKFKNQGLPPSIIQQNQYPYGLSENTQPKVQINAMGGGQGLLMQNIESANVGVFKLTNAMNAARKQKLNVNEQQQQNANLLGVEQQQMQQMQQIQQIQQIQQQLQVGTQNQSQQIHHVKQISGGLGHFQGLLPNQTNRNAHFNKFNNKNANNQNNNSNSFYGNQIKNYSIGNNNAYSNTDDVYNKYQ